MKKLVSILLILSTVLCFTACQSKPSEEKIKKALEGEFVYSELVWYWSPSSYSPESLLKDIQNTRAFKYEDNKLSYSNVQFEIKILKSNNLQTKKNNNLQMLQHIIQKMKKKHPLKTKLKK